MQSQWTLQDAKNKFSEVVNAARAGTPQVVTRRGEPTVVILSTEQYRHLLKAGTSLPPSFADLLLSMPKGEPFNAEPGNSEQILREVEF